MSDGSQIAGATLGAWTALTLGSVADAAFRKRPRWYAWFTAIAAVIGAISVVDTVSLSTGGVFASLGFMAFVVWALVSAIVMVRRPLMA